MSDNPNITTPDPSSVSPHTVNFYTQGYQCQCGVWVFPGNFHRCYYTQPLQQYPQPAQAVWDSALLGRIAVALERIAASLEEMKGNDGD